MLIGFYVLLGAQMLGDFRFTKNRISIQSDEWNNWMEIDDREMENKIVHLAI